MPILISDLSWKWLSESQQLDDSSFLVSLKHFLLRDFHQAFEVIKTQKLLSRSRSQTATTSVCTDLIRWTHDASLHNKSRLRLRRHCQITIGLQTIMSSLQARTAIMSVWSLSPNDLSTILIGSLEATNIATNGELLTRMHADNRSDFLQLNSNKNLLMRSMLDTALLVLNEGRKRCHMISDYEIGSPKAFGMALQLGLETAELATIWDSYSFGRFQISLDGKGMQVNRPNAQTSGRLSQYRQRMMELDVAHRSVAYQRFNVLAEQIKCDLQEEVLSSAFEDFIASPLGKQILRKLLNITFSLQRELTSSLESLIDLNSEVKLGKLKHVYSDLVTIWCLIVRLAMVSRIWGESIHAKSGEYPNAIVSIEAIKSTSTGLRDISNSALDKGLHHFSSFLDQRAPIDLFHNPLLRLGDHQALLPASYILASRFDRNLLSVVAREKNYSIATKGKKPLKNLKARFENSGFKCIEDLKIKDQSGNTLTDLDLLALQGNQVFVFQSKVLSIPDTPYEYWRVDQVLLQAAAQMDIVLQHLEQVEHACKRLEGPSSPEEIVITPYLLTDVMVHSGFKLGGYQVVDFERLEHLLSGAKLVLLDVLKREIVATGSEIEGKVLTPQEFQRLAAVTSVAAGSKRYRASQRRINSGGWTLTFDVTSFS